MEKKILVTGATGTLGRALVKSLKEKQASFSVAVRDPKAATGKLGSYVDAVPFDFAKPETFAKATENVGRVFLLAPPLNTSVEALLTPFINHLKTVGIKKVVYISALGIDLIPSLPFHSIIIKKLEDTGFDYTILQPSFFAQNFKNYEWENITQRSITYNVAGSGKVAFIDAEDIGRSAAAVLTSEGHKQKTYTLTGPEALSYSDAAEVLSDVLGKKIVYPNPSAEEYSQALKAAGAPDFIASYMIPVYSLIANNHVNLVTNDVETLTGRKPTHLKEVLKRDFASVTVS
jgi:uncharacterized protein YbjT (DUF2867 family)